MTASAIVTGGSRGLGLALVRSLSEDGWRVVTDARAAGDLDAALRGLRGVTAIAGDVADPAHRHALVEAAGDRIDVLVNSASTLGPGDSLGALADVREDQLELVLRVNVVAPLALVGLALPRLAPGACVIDVSSDAAVEAYEGWGAYGASKAALDHLTAVFAAEHPGLRFYAADPGDMRTRMQQQAFPGEDISDRPPPESSVPGLRALIGGKLPSGRYRVRELEPVSA